MRCRHCAIKDTLVKGLCLECSKFDKCEGCSVVFGLGFSVPSELNQLRCEQCLFFEDNIELKCKGCNKRTPLFYSVKNKILNHIVRGNFCKDCNGYAGAKSKEALKYQPFQEYSGYLHILYTQFMMGKIGALTFEEAKESNPHDINRPSTRK